MKRFIVFTCAFSVVLSLTVAWAGPLDIPDDYREHANTVEFLTHMGHRCDTRLSIYGEKALADGELCRAFLTQVRKAMQVEKATQERWTTFIRAVGQSNNQFAKQQLRTFLLTYNEHLHIIDKVVAHIRFLQTS